MPRLLLAVLQVVILASCPIWCSTVEAGFGASCAHGTDSAAPTPVNDDNCICNGALAVPAPASPSELLPSPAFPLPDSGPLAAAGGPGAVPGLIYGSARPPGAPDGGLRAPKMMQLQALRC